MSTLHASNLVKIYKSRSVVDDVSFDVNSGEVVGLLGPNGAGKTTSFYMVVGLIQPDKGDRHRFIVASIFEIGEQHIKKPRHDFKLPLLPDIQ